MAASRTRAQRRKGGPARSGDCVRTGHMVAMTVETREVVGDKKIRSQVFDEHSDICGELVNVSCKLTIAETRVDNSGDAEDARRALGLSAPAVCECRLHNAGRIPSLSPVSTTRVTSAPDAAKRCSVPPQVTVSSSACGNTATTCLKRRISPAGTRRSVVKSSAAAQNPAAPARLKLAPSRMLVPARGHRTNRTTSVSLPGTNRSESYRAGVVGALGQ